MGMFSDSIKVTGSHVQTPKTAESALIASSSDPLNKATILQAVKLIQATGGTVNLNLNRFSTDTFNPGGKHSADQVVAIKPGESAESIADQIMAALTAQGADRAEKGLVAATLNASASSLAGRDLTGQTITVTISTARAGGLAEYAAR